MEEEEEEKEGEGRGREKLGVGGEMEEMGVKESESKSKKKREWYWALIRLKNFQHSLFLSGKFLLKELFFLCMLNYSFKSTVFMG